jgi:hypothetical protein
MESKKAKTPPLSQSTKLLSFDLETNGLHGPAFAVGAVVMDAKGNVIDQFTARVKIDGQVDPAVEEKILPALKDMPITHKTYKDLRESFWRWYIKTEPEVDYVLVNNGYPVEYRFLLQCQEENLEERYWQHPFPILDLTSLWVQVAPNPAEKSKYINQLLADGGLSRHNPFDDAIVTALAAFKAFRLADRL